MDNTKFLNQIKQGEYSNDIFSTKLEFIGNGNLLDNKNKFVFVSGGHFENYEEIRESLESIYLTSKALNSGIITYFNLDGEEINFQIIKIAVLFNIPLILITQKEFFEFNNKEIEFSNILDETNNGLIIHSNENEKLISNIASIGVIFNHAELYEKELEASKIFHKEFKTLEDPFFASQDEDIVTKIQLPKDEMEM